MKRKKMISNRKRLKQKLLIAGVVIVLIAAYAFIYYVMQKDKADNPAPTPTTSEGAILDPNASPEQSAEPSPEVSVDPILNKSIFIDEKFNPTSMEKIEKKISKKLSSNGPSLAFVVKGVYGIDEEKKRSQISIYQIDIINEKDNSILQTINEIKTYSSVNGKKEILENDITFTDWNYDGYLDFDLKLSSGKDNAGKEINNNFKIIWLWNNASSQFVVSDTLTLVANSNGKVFKASDGRTATTTYYGEDYETKYYAYNNGAFVVVESISVEYLNDDAGKKHEYKEISKIVNGELQLVETTLDGKKQSL